MLEDEARLRYELMLHDQTALQQRAKWDEIRRFERLQRSIRLVSARLGFRIALGD